jgi:aspartyl-tRNA(Asn)/glutamyl-tRNA(Gln) amidotransferase subunit A
MSATTTLDLSAADTAVAIASGSASAADVADAALARLQANAQLNAFVTIAAAADARLAAASAPNGALHGVPVAVKDNIATTTLSTSCGSRILQGWISPYEATAVTKLRNAGAVIIGKTNMDEFAMGSSTENSAFGPTLNPLDLARVPGGSSGGSAAAVAAGLCRISFGSETGGSVRQPAAFCGIVGVKPTYGRVSRFGLVAFASSLDHIGVFGRSVDDAALGLQVIAGHDPRDATTSDVAVADYRAEAGKPLAGLVVGVPTEYFPVTLDERIRTKCHRAIGMLRDLGAEVRQVSLPHTEFAIPVYYILAPAEASSNLARFDGVRYGPRAQSDDLRGMYEGTRSHGFGPEVTRRIILGTYVLSQGHYDAYYRKAMLVREQITADFAKVFRSGVHVLFTPTAPSPAFGFGTKSDPLEMYLSDIFTATANLAGVPAMSQPIGLVDGMPIGGQLLAAHFCEADMFRAAYALEKALGSEALS